MKTNFTSPVWLQSASNVGKEGYEVISFYSNGAPTVVLSSIGDITITYRKEGSFDRMSLSEVAGESVYIPADAGTEVKIRGVITEFSTFTNRPLYSGITSLNLSRSESLNKINITANNYLKELDLSKNVNLEYFDAQQVYISSYDFSNNVLLKRCNVQGNDELKMLDLGENPNVETINIVAANKLETIISKSSLLTTIGFTDNPALTRIDIYATTQDVATRVASAITNATSVDGTVTLRQGDEFNQTIIDAAMEKGWDVQYYQ